MELAFNLVLLAVCAIACALLAVALRREQATVRALRDQLKAATAAQLAKDTQLDERSHLDTIKDEFISTVSHELRTPLTSIRGALGLLSAGLMGTVDAKAQNLLRIAVTNTDRLIRLINDILDLERMQSGRAPLQVRRCSLRDLAQQAIETMTPMAESTKVRLDLVLNAPVESVYFDGDSDRILQVLTNLLSNAIKFSPLDSVVEVGIDADDDSVLVRVSDRGRGIPADKLDTIFDRFQQVEASDARQKGGTGLGLAICRTIVQQHNGCIWAESNNHNHRGPGASLLVSLPRVSRMEDPLPRTMTLLRGASDNLQPAGTSNVIVLCDDDAGVRTVVGEQLRQHGYEIVEAETGEQAIALAAEHLPEAILLDLYMPGLSGWETLEKLKHTPATAQIPVVILSVLPPAGDTAKAQGWVQKPFQNHLLLGELSRVLRRGEGPAHVLLVEDDVDLAAVVLAGFDGQQVRVDHASTRHAAIEYCLLARPDLMILDLTLPDGDGFSLVDWLRQQPGLRALPLVVYSGREINEEERAQLRLGPTQFLTKAKVQPSEVEELVLNIVERLRDRPDRGSDRGSGSHLGNGAAAASHANGSASRTLVSAPHPAISGETPLPNRRKLDRRSETDAGDPPSATGNPPSAA